MIGGNAQAKASKQAAQLQYDSAMAGINETRRQFDITQANYEPFRQLGISAAPKFANLAGLGTVDAQMAEIEALKNSPYYQSLFNNGRDAMLATASASGGLRGGNFQDASMRFGADTLSTAIDKQLATYAGAVGIGSGATDAVSNFGAQAVASQNGMRMAGADAQAQARLVQGGIAARNWQNMGSTLDSAMSAATGGGKFNFKSLF